MTGKAQMPAPDLDEERITRAAQIATAWPRRPMTMPATQSCSPSPMARQRTVQDREGPRRTGQQDRLGQRTMHRDGEARDIRQLLEGPVHQISARRRS